MPDLPADLRIVQRWLEPWLRILGGSGVPTMYQSARDIHDLLNRFQQQVMREPFPSGTVIPGDRTERKLKERPPLMQPRIPIRPPLGVLPLNPLPGTSLVLPARTGFKPLSAEDYQQAADDLGCEPLLIKALGIVEGRGRGFDHFNRIMILFEPTKFAKYAMPKPNLYRTQHYDITHRRLPPLTLYGPDSLQWSHLQEAYLLDPHAALKATSWGHYQQLGYYYHLTGYGNVEQMVTAMCGSEQDQLKCFVNRIRSGGMQPDMANKDWNTIAKKYNGAASVGYDVKLKAVYEGLKNGS